MEPLLAMPLDKDTSHALKGVAEAMARYDFEQASAQVSDLLQRDREDA